MNDATRSPPPGSALGTRRPLRATFGRRGWALAFACGLGTSMLAAHAAGNAYVPRGQCAGYPRIDVQTAAGTCVALLADASSGLRFPRRVLEVAHGRFWLVDMGSWEPNQGRLLEFTMPSANATGSQSASPPPRVAFKVLAERLDRPHGISLGPEGRVYIGEAGRIVRTAIGAPGQPVVLQTVIDRLPTEGKHPLKELVFGPDGHLFVNVGSGTDACGDENRKQAVPCAEGEGDGNGNTKRPRAAVYEAVFTGPDLALHSFEPYARGLRNSLALAFLPGTRVLLQGENNIDYSDEAAPPEELNVLRSGAHYGWPYCVGMRTAAHGYEGRFDCARTTPPVALWPAHVAPLQMTAVPRDAHNRYAGQMVVAWHGYRPAGHRVIRMTVDSEGRPMGSPTAVIDGWDAKAGVRPQGAPTGVFVDADGRLYVVEDHNKTLLMVISSGP